MNQVSHELGQHKQNCPVYDVCGCVYDNDLSHFCVHFCVCDDDYCLVYHFFDDANCFVYHFFDDVSCHVYHFYDVCENDDVCYCLFVVNYCLFEVNYCHFDIDCHYDDDDFDDYHVYLLYHDENFCCSLYDRGGHEAKCYLCCY